MAGFEVTLYGRIWVTPKGTGRECGNLRTDGSRNRVFSILGPAFALTPFIQDKSLMR
jgi:hypothetical protein